MAFIRAIFLLLIFHIAQINAYAAFQDIIPANPKRRIAPTYPASCKVKNEENSSEHKVTLTYDITTAGEVENIRITSPSDPCFNDNAIAAASRWTFTPRTEQGKRTKQEATETTITFKLDDETKINEYDAQPIYRVPPKYPDFCQRLAGLEEYVVLEFDVSTKGKPEKPRVLETSKSCFNRSAINALTKWKYDPKTVDGVPVVRKNIVTRITFLLSTRPSYDIRKSFLGQIKKARSKTRAKKYNKAQAAFDKIEEKYKKDMSPAERALFHQMRGSLRLSTQDYPGALDDLRLAQRGSLLSDKTHIAIGETIKKLELSLGLRPGAQ